MKFMVEKERKVVLEEIAKDANSANTMVYDNLISLLYTNHPYKRKVIGTSEIINGIHRDEILSYYNTYYGPSNMVTVIVGDIDPQKAVEKVKQEFGTECKKSVKNNFPPEKPLSKQLRKTEYTDTNSGYMLIGFRGVKINDKDSYALDVLAAILGSGRSSILYRDIKEQKQLAFSTGAANAGFREDSIFYISANFIPEKQNKLENEIFNEINNIQKSGVTDEQLKVAKNIIERDTYYSRESVSNIANEIGYTYVTTDDIKYYETYLDNIKKVTADEVKHAANKYLGKDKSAVSVVLPRNMKEVKISNTRNNEDIAPAQLISGNSKTSKYKLSNGAELLISPNDINDIVAISIYAKGGEFIEKIPGTANLTASLLLKGTKKYSASELAQTLEDKGIKIEPGIRPDAFTLTVLTTKNELKQTYEILDEIVNNALLSSYELDKVRDEKLNNIKKSRDIPLTLAAENYKNLIYENSPYSNGSIKFEKTFPIIKADDIKSYYDKVFDAKNVVISVNGNVNSQEVINEFGKIFGDKNLPEFSYKAHLSEIPALKSVKTSVKTVKDLKTDWIIIGWQTPGVMNQKEYAALQVIDSLLGTGMSSRLFRNLRDKDGLAYQLGSEYSPNILGGSFIVYIGTNPENLEIAKSKLFEQINILKKEFVGSKELQEAKDKLTGQYLISKETNLDKAATIGWFEISGRGYEFDDEYEKLINSVTESDIIDCANKYFNNNYVISVVKPQ